MSTQLVVTQPTRRSLSEYPRFRMIPLFSVRTNLLASFKHTRRLSNMQSSITQFFQVKSPKSQASGASSSTLATPTKDAQKDSEETKKRRADSDENKSDAKRQALASPEFTPIKKDKSEPDDKSFKTAQEIMTTPSKRPSEVAPAKPFSPLTDMRAAINAKMNSGAWALHPNMGASWYKALHPEFSKPYFKKLSDFIKQERAGNVVFPPHDKVYTWTHFHDIKETRVIILGQDPYHGPGQAHGLSFSVQEPTNPPPSLVNIYKELECDIDGFVAPRKGDLTGWSKQGVLLLNTCLTVRRHQANSHRNKGWEPFTDAVITYISKNLKHNAVFMLWGSPAQTKAKLIDKRHKILRAVHPSPLSAHKGFFGCKHFSQCNTFLRSQNLPEIDWKNL